MKLMKPAEPKREQIRLTTSAGPIVFVARRPTVDERLADEGLLVSRHKAGGGAAYAEQQRLRLATCVVDWAMVYDEADAALPFTTEGLFALIDQVPDALGPLLDAIALLYQGQSLGEFALPLGVVSEAAG